MGIGADAVGSDEAVKMPAGHVVTGGNDGIETHIAKQIWLKFKLVSYSDVENVALGSRQSA